MNNVLNVEIVGAKMPQASFASESSMMEQTSGLAFGQRVWRFGLYRTLGGRGGRRLGVTSRYQTLVAIDDS